jgi:hypothetical protein
LGSRHRLLDGEHSRTVYLGGDARGLRGSWLCALSQVEASGLPSRLTRTSVEELRGPPRGGLSFLCGPKPVPCRFLLTTTVCKKDRFDRSRRRRGAAMDCRRMSDICANRPFGGRQRRRRRGSRRAAVIVRGLRSYACLPRWFRTGRDASGNRTGSSFQPGDRCARAIGSAPIGAELEIPPLAPVAEVHHRLRRRENQRFRVDLSMCRSAARTMSASGSARLGKAVTKSALRFYRRTRRTIRAVSLARRP